MSSSADIRKKIADIAGKRAAIERQASDASSRQATKQADYAKKTEQAMKTSSDSLRRSYLSQATSAQNAAITEGKKVADLSRKLAALAKDDGTQQKALGEALKREATDQENKAKKARQDEERRRTDERRADERRAAAQRRADEQNAARQRSDDAWQREQDRLEDRSHTQALVGSAEERLAELIHEATRPPKQEQLRILYATANSGGDLRVDEEIRRVLAVVQASTHRDQVSIKHLPAATAEDLIGGLMSFRPHVVHFSGHSAEDVLVFDTGGTAPGEGLAVPADAFAAAMDAPDEPPRVVVLNSCNSAPQLQALLGKVAIAIGMSDSVGDADAITFATRFYATLAEGQSVSAAHAAARANMRMIGLPDHDLPTMEAVPGVDPGQVRLVQAST